MSALCEDLAPHQDRSSEGERLIELRSLREEEDVMPHRAGEIRRLLDQLPVLPGRHPAPVERPGDVRPHARRDLVRHAKPYGVGGYVRRHYHRACRGQIRPENLAGAWLAAAAAGLWQ